MINKDPGNLKHLKYVNNIQKALDCCFLRDYKFLIRSCKNDRQQFQSRVASVSVQLEYRTVSFFIVLLRQKLDDPGLIKREKRKPF